MLDFCKLRYEQQFGNGVLGRKWSSGKLNDREKNIKREKGKEEKGKERKSGKRERWRVREEKHMGRHEKNVKKSKENENGQLALQVLSFQSLCFMVQGLGILWYLPLLNLS